MACLWLSVEVVSGCTGLFGSRILLGLLSVWTIHKIFLQVANSNSQGTFHWYREGRGSLVFFLT